MTISVVIPAWNEGANLSAALESARGHGVEIVVVDGGSRDETVQVARDAGVRVLESDQGRARQLRMGSENTKGSIILFLHADTRLPEGWGPAVERAMGDPQVAGGAFALRFSERGFGAVWIEFWVRVRVGLFGLPYGDQALFVRREVLERMGGVPIVPVMEDLDLVRGIKAAGVLRMLPLSVTTSRRRYARAGTLRTIAGHLYALIGWVLDWDREQIRERIGR